MLQFPAPGTRFSPYYHDHVDGGDATHFSDPCLKCGGTGSIPLTQGERNSILGDPDDGDGETAPELLGDFRSTTARSRKRQQELDRKINASVVKKELRRLRKMSQRQQRLENMLPEARAGELERERELRAKKKAAKKQAKRQAKKQQQQQQADGEAEDEQQRHRRQPRPRGEMKTNPQRSPRKAEEDALRAQQRAEDARRARKEARAAERRRAKMFAPCDVCSGAGRQPRPTTPDGRFRHGGLLWWLGMQGGLAPKFVNPAGADADRLVAITARPGWVTAGTAGNDTAAAADDDDGGSSRSAKTTAAATAAGAQRGARAKQSGGARRPRGGGGGGGGGVRSVAALATSSSVLDSLCGDGVESGELCCSADEDLASFTIDLRDERILPLAPTHYRLRHGNSNVFYAPTHWELQVCRTTSYRIASYRIASHHAASRRIAAPTPRNRLRTTACSGRC